MFKYLDDKYKLHSGRESRIKIECDELSIADIKSIASIIASKIRFSQVVGIPRGGLLLEYFLKFRIDVRERDTLLIVDDVLTTGNSMEEYRRKYQYYFKNVVGFVVFARGDCPEWITPLFTMNQTFWDL